MSNSTRVVVGGHLIVDPAGRDDYLRGCVAVVEAARTAPGCRDFAISADLLDPGRINVHEEWASAEALAAFRGSGPGEDQSEAMLSASVREHDVSETRSLTD